MAGRGSGVREVLSIRISPWGLLSVCGAMASGATVLGLLGRFWWAFDLFSHFRAQYFYTLLTVAFLFLVRRRYWATTGFGLFAVLNLCSILPLYFGAEQQRASAPPTCRAMLINVNTGSGRPDLVAQAIDQFRPDLLLLEEISDKWVAALSQQLKQYPNSRVMPRDDNFGIGLYSKHPLVDGEIRYLGDAEIPSVVAVVQSPAGRFTIIGTHPLPPASGENTRLRDGQLTELPTIVKQANSPVLLIGDLNATPWCSEFHRLLRESGLRNSSQGRGVQPTWPTFMPLLLIPIDHCLYGPGMRVTAKRVGPKVGSDHYPIIVDFVLEPVASKP